MKIFYNTILIAVIIVLTICLFNIGTDYGNNLEEVSVLNETLVEKFQVIEFGDSEYIILTYDGIQHGFLLHEGNYKRHSILEEVL